MFTRKEYPNRLESLNLSKEQVQGLRAILVEMAAYAARIANNASDNVRADYFYGKSDGINAVDRFLRGDMDAHDEFEDE